MSIFKEIEKRLENLFEGFFNNRWRSTIQPVELARKMVAEMDRARRISVTVTYAPNIFTVGLAPADLTEIERFKESLLRELTNYLTAHAQAKQYHLTGAFNITLTADPDLPSGDCRIETHIEERPAPVEEHTQIISAEEARLLLTAARQARLDDEASGLTYPLKSKSITIGRQADNDIVLDSPGVSRHHARLDLDGSAYRLVDLSSTNGTFINDEEVDQALLADGDNISLGNVVLIFRLTS
ncbi:MAG: DUF3662 and FHA domain-containing protein [Actinomycetota bacterium]|nr:DUF3662 and FHA domain-containing protein [Actinomycetota bacterium]